jgi:O-acetyl-ADP-ribose deacetylase (regulator of RNase III)
MGSLFKDKVVICKEEVADVEAAAFINLCYPNILYGPRMFRDIHTLAGPDLIQACQKFRNMCPTSVRSTESFNARNYGFIVHTIVPPLSSMTGVDLSKMYLVVRNALDRAVEEGADTIAFPGFFPGLSFATGSEAVLRIFATWLAENPNADYITEIRVICPTDLEFNSFLNASRRLMALGQMPNANPSLPKVLIPSNYRAALMARMEEGEAYDNRRRVRRVRRSPGRFASTSSAHDMGHGDTEVSTSDPLNFKLELSAKLCPTILVLDDENGNKRQFRVTNRSRDGRKIYFRCSRCDTAAKKDNNQIRAKIIISDGKIVSDHFPEHHPNCIPLKQEDYIVQKVDRSSRKEVKEGRLLPEEAYLKACQEMENTTREPELSNVKFPEWNRIRQQYSRIRKQAIKRDWANEQAAMEHHMGHPHEEDDDDEDAPLRRSKRACKRTWRMVEYADCHEVLPIRPVKSEEEQEFDVNVTDDGDEMMIEPTSSHDITKMESAAD